MTPTRIINARLDGLPGLHALSLASGRISGSRSQAGSGLAAAAPGDLDAAGGLVTASLVDPHLHLDLAYTLEVCETNRSGTLLEAIGIWSREKARLTPGDVRRRAVRAIRSEVGWGTGLIRSHVDVASAAGTRLAEGVLAARDDTRDLCRIELVAFPQDGLIRDPGAIDCMKQALAMGVDVVGGIPHVERTPEDGLKHLQKVFELADKPGLRIDVHIDETDDPNSRYTERLAALTIERGMQGRVTASHVCALAGYDEVHASKVMDLLAEARVNVVTNPGVNLHLQGRFDRYPKRRGLTRVRDLLSRGVICGAGQDCIRDVFYPLGNGCMLDQAFLLAHAEHMTGAAGRRAAFGMVCDMAAEVVGAVKRGVAEGPADLAIFPAESIDDLVRERPRPTWVLFGGRVVSGA